MHTTFGNTNPYSLLEIKPSPVHGRGLFAKFYIRKGQKIECEVIVMSDVAMASSDMQDYCFPWEGKKKCVCAGFGSFFNHNSDPNFKIKSIDKERFTKTFEALKDIKPGQELFLYYNDSYDEELKNGK